MSKKLIYSLQKTMGKLTQVSDLIIVDKNLFGDEEEHTLTWCFFDGFAYCPNYQGKSYVIKNLPKVSYFKANADDAKTMLENNNLTSVNDLTPFIIAQYYGTITELSKAEDEDFNLEEFVKNMGNGK